MVLGALNVTCFWGYPGGTVSCSEEKWAKETVRHKMVPKSLEVREIVLCKQVKRGERSPREHQFAQSGAEGKEPGGKTEKLDEWKEENHEGCHKRQKGTFQKRTNQHVRCCH